MLFKLNPHFYNSIYKLSPGIYILNNNYFSNDSKFPPQIWSDFSSIISIKTNNREFFYSKLNMFYKTQPKIN